MPPIRRSRNTAPPSVWRVRRPSATPTSTVLTSFGLVIVSEDAVWQLTDAPEVHVLNQWTYHSRMYGAAKYVTQKENAQLIQLVSFGCGIDAITTDEMRAICENGGKIYTQLKIDEISNLGAAKIRIRSMLAAVEEGRKLAEHNA